MKIRHPLVLIGMLASLLLAAPEGPVSYEWSAQAVDGQTVKVPAPSAATVLAFVRPDQAQSQSVLEQIHRVVAHAKQVKVIVVISGERAVRAAAAKTGVDKSWPVVLDPDFAASGKFNVHVWPTTVVVQSTGKAAAHLPGLSISFAADLEDYLAYATGAIDESTLKQRLSEHEVVGEGNAAKADRQLALAMQLMESGRLEQAAALLADAVQQRPGEAKPALLLARIHLHQDRPAEALHLLDALPPGAVPAFQLNVLRARALINLKRWDEARQILPETLKLNPNPAESHYLTGLIAQHDGNWEQAAESFRRAYELSAGRSP